MLYLAIYDIRTYTRKEREREREREGGREGGGTERLIR